MSMCMFDALMNKTFTYFTEYLCINYNRIRQGNFTILIQFNINIQYIWSSSTQSTVLLMYVLKDYKIQF